MKENDINKFALKIEKVRAIGKKNTRRLLLMFFLFIFTGVTLAYVFRNIDTEVQYISVLGLMSQVIAFSAALMLSEQFLNIPEKISGIHDFAIATTMSAPICVWLGNVMYTATAIVLNATYSEIWSEAVTISCWGLGMVIYGFGSIEQGLNLKIKDKSAVVGWGWYMVFFSLGLQIYISLIELEIISRFST